MNAFFSGYQAALHREAVRPAGPAPSFDGLGLAHLILDMGFGGAERLAQNLAIAMGKCGARCHVLCLDAVSGNTEPLARHGIPVELVKRRQVPFDPVVCLRLVRRLRALGIGLLHAHDLASLAYAVAAGRVLGIPVVMTEHSRHYIEERGLRRLEKRLLCLGVGRLVTVSPELAAASASRDGVRPDKVTVIENGVDAERFACACRQVLREELDLADDALLVGMVGRLETIKGPDVLLAAFAGLASWFPEARLAFAGEGALESGLRGTAEALGLSDRVHFLGSRADIPDVMAGLDVLALPSRSEGLPFALLEGMAAGRAVAATAVGRVPGLVKPTEGPPNGLLVPPGDAAALAGALASLLADAPLRLRLGGAARDFVERRYDQRVMVRDYQTVYRRVLAGRAGL
uniref:Glycosyltransferase n=1 Tax=Desulfovibrio sp. U5L TaxID=596152 RepID=I2Q318_9BACT